MSELLALVAAVLIAGSGLAIMSVALRYRGVVDLEELLGEFDAAPEDFDEYTQQLRDPLTQRLLLPLGRSVTSRLQSLLPRNHMGTISRRLVLAGLSGRFGPEEYMAAQVVGTAAGILVGILAAVGLGWQGSGIIALVALAGAVGFSLPAVYVKQHRDLRVEAIESELADVLDVLAITVEAGVGLEGAIQAVNDRFSSPLSAELGHMLSEMELGLSRRDALQNLRSRTEIPDLSGFVLALLQADALGMPLTRVLQTQSEEMRRRRRAKVREAAAKLPVKLLFPMILLILPALFIVIMGPAVLQISNNLVN